MIKKRVWICITMGAIIMIAGIFSRIYDHRTFGLGFTFLGLAIMGEGLKGPRTTESDKWERDDIMAWGFLMPGSVQIIRRQGSALKYCLTCLLSIICFGMIITSMVRYDSLGSLDVKIGFLVVTLSFLTWVTLIAWSSMDAHQYCQKLNLPFTGSQFESRICITEKKIRVVLLSAVFLGILLLLIDYFLIGNRSSIPDVRFSDRGSQILHDLLESQAERWTAVRRTCVFASEAL